MKRAALDRPAPGTSKIPPTVLAQSRRVGNQFICAPSVRFSNGGDTILATECRESDVYGSTTVRMQVGPF